MKRSKVLLPEGIAKTTGILISMLRIFVMPYGATDLGYSLKDVNLGKSFKKRRRCL